MLSAMLVATHNAEFRKYYLRKVAEGKPKRLVLNNVANKLLKIVCALVKTERSIFQISVSQSKSLDFVIVFKLTLQSRAHFQSIVELSKHTIRYETAFCI